MPRRSRSLPLLTTPAIVLATMRYRETSKIVRLATREAGIQSAIARGASRPRSRFGAALQFLSEGVATFTTKEGRELHTLTAFDVTVIRLPLARDLTKYAAAAALAETTVRFHPAEANPAAYDLLAQGLAGLEEAASPDAEAVGLALLWQVVGALGFSPSVDRCARDGRLVDAARPVAFSFADGGALCAACAHDHTGPVLPPPAYAQLLALVDPAGAPAALDERHATAHRRLLAKYIHYHLGEGAPLPALEFWVRGSGPAVGP